MKRWQRYFAGLAIAVGVVDNAAAQQFPGIPSPTPVPPAPVAAAPVTAAAPQQTLWGWLGCSKEQKEQCRQWLCQSQLGLLLNNGMAPATMFSGGIIPSLCPGLPTAAELNSENPAVKAAANIKKDEAEAKARRAAVRYLATVSCHYWPEAEDALIAALMFDRNECVRWEAAISLGTGCCCTKNTIEALAITASGSKKKRNFTEKSERVRAAAEAALYHCLDCYHEVVPAPAGPEKPPEEPAKKPEEPVTAVPRHSNIQLAAFYAEIEGKSMTDVLENARKVLHDTAARKPAMTGNFTTGNRNVYQILTNSVQLQSRKMKVFGMERNMQPAPAAHPEPEPPSNLYQVLRNRIEKREPGIQMEIDAGNANTKTAKPAELTPVSTSAPAAVPIPPMPPPAATKPESTPNTTNNLPPVTGTEPPLAGLDRAKSAPTAKPTMNVEAASNTEASHQGWLPKKSSYPVLDRFSKSKSTAKEEPTQASHNAPAPTIKPVAHITNQMPGSAATVPIARVAPQSSSVSNAPAVSSYRPATKSMADSAGKAQPMTSTQMTAWNNTSTTSTKPVVQQTPQARPTAIVAQPVESPAPAARDRGMPSVPGLLIIFQDSPESPQRQWAVQVLSRHDWSKHPEVVPAVLAGAQKDTDRAVRIQCIRCLTSRQVNSPAVLAAFRDLQKDADARVQQEATEGLSRLSVRANNSSNSENTVDSQP